MDSVYEACRISVLPRMVALSEIAWVQPEAKPNLKEFYRQLVPHFKRMDVMGLNYRVPDLEGFYQVNAFLDETSVDLTCPLPGIEVRYTTDGACRRSNLLFTKAI